MKKKAFIPLLLLIPVVMILNSCKTETIESKKSDLLENLKKDLVFSNYTKTNDSIKVNLAIDYYNISKINKQLIKKEALKTTNVNALIKVYENAGMKNAENYFFLTLKSMYYLNRLKTKYPELETLSPSERAKLFIDAAENEKKTTSKLIKLLSKKTF